MFDTRCLCVIRILGSVVCNGICCFPRTYSTSSEKTQNNILGQESGERGQKEKIEERKREREREREESSKRARAKRCEVKGLLLGELVHRLVLARALLLRELQGVATLYHPLRPRAAAPVCETGAFSH